MIRSISLSYFVLLVAASTLSDPIYVGPETWQVLACAAPISAVLAHLLRQGSRAGATLAAVFGLAYLTGSQLPLARGFPHAPLSTGRDFVWQGLVVAVVFICVTSVLASALATSRLLRAGTGLAIRLAEGGGVSLFNQAFVGMFAASAWAAFSVGAWSNYSSELEVRQASGAHLEVIYPICVFGLLTLSTERVLVATDRTELRVRKIAWLVLLGIAFVLMFLLQSRRLLVAAIVLGITGFILRRPDRMMAARPPRGWRSPLVWTMALAILMAGALWASHYWRLGGQGRRSISMSERFDTAASMAGGGQEGEVLEAGLVRLQYLWIDGATQQYFSGRPSELGAGTALLHTIIYFTPGVIFPDKYDYPRVTCESIFKKFGLTFDLTCTPTSEAFALGGWVGLLFCALLWTAGVALADAFLAHPGNSRTVLGAVVIAPFATIEAGAFPIIGAMRQLIVSLGFFGLVAIAGLLLLPMRRSLD